MIPCPVVGCNLVLNTTCQLKMHKELVHQKQVKVTYKNGLPIYLRRNPSGIFQCTKCIYTSEHPQNMRKHASRCDVQENVQQHDDNSDDEDVNDERQGVDINQLPFHLQEFTQQPPAILPFHLAVYTPLKLPFCTHPNCRTGLLGDPINHAQKLHGPLGINDNLRQAIENTFQELQAVDANDPLLASILSPSPHGMEPLPGITMKSAFICVLCRNEDITVCSYSMKTITMHCKQEHNDTPLNECMEPCNVQQLFRKVPPGKSLLIPIQGNIIHEPPRDLPLQIQQWQKEILENPLPNLPYNQRDVAGWLVQLGIDKDTAPFMDKVSSFSFSFEFH
jgi:hypothetical protein